MLLLLRFLFYVKIKIVEEFFLKNIYFICKSVSVFILEFKILDI